MAGFVSVTNLTRGSTGRHRNHWKPKVDQVERLPKAAMIDRLQVFFQMSRRKKSWTVNCFEGQGGVATTVNDFAA